MSRYRQIQKNMGRKINDEDYILTNQRTRGTAVIRKNDYEREDAFVWMKGLKNKD
jgi:hypothetical protein